MNTSRDRVFVSKLESFPDTLDYSLSSEEARSSSELVLWKYINHHHVAGAAPQNPNFQAEITSFKPYAISFTAARRTSDGPFE